jgi:hypothetical protein
VVRVLAVSDEVDDALCADVRPVRAAQLTATDAEAYLGVARERYRLMRTHEWNDEVIDRLRQQFRLPRRH